jgi:pteridine reductase
MTDTGLPLAGKAALVTGAAKRLGRAVALALAEQGADVAVHYGGSSADAAATAEDIRRFGRRAWTLQADLAQADQAEGLMPRAIQAAGRVDILINSASIFPPGRIGQVSVADMLTNIQVHAIAPLLLCRALAAQGVACHVINFLDSRMTDYDADHAAYHVSKRMLLTLTKMLALELAPAVAINAVAPGAILPAAGQDDAAFQRLADANPLKRVGNPGEIVRAVLFLLTSNFITGQVIFVDGGRHMKGCVYG